MSSIHQIAVLALAVAGCERAAPSPVYEVHDWVDQIYCRLQDGVVECRGLNTWGTVRDPAAEIVVDEWHRIPIGEPVTRIDLSVTGLFACAATRSGRAYCWGDAYEGALGNGELPPDDYRYRKPSSSARPVPQQVIGLGDVRELGLGLRHACALTHAGAVHCWGAGHVGALGDGNDNAPSAKAIEVIPEGATSIVVADFQTCALLSTRRVVCWGDHLPDEAGVRQPVPRPTEVVNLDRVTAISGARVEMCAAGRRGRRCWKTTPERFDVK